MFFGRCSVKPTAEMFMCPAPRRQLVSQERGLCFRQVCSAPQNYSESSSTLATAAPASTGPCAHALCSFVRVYCWGPGTCSANADPGRRSFLGNGRWALVIGLICQEHRLIKAIRWMDEMHYLRNPRMMIPHRYQQTMVSPWFQSGANGFRPFTGPPSIAVHFGRKRFLSSSVPRAFWHRSA